MGMQEIRALQAKRTGNKPDETSHVPIKESGPKPRKPLRRVGLKQQKENREIKKAGGDPDKIALDLFFHNVAYQFSPGTCHCWECGAYIPTPFIRHATAHIFPKADFESVMINMSNYLILGASCCHDKTHVIASFRKMKIWPEAVDRFIEFEPHLNSEDRKSKYYALFLETAKADFPDKFIKPDQNLLGYA